MVVELLSNDPNDPAFMGQASGDAGAPFADFESSEGAELGTGHNLVWRSIAGGTPPVPDDGTIENAPNFASFQYLLQRSGHDTAHGYIGGTLSDAHYSFHDPFVFLLHSNMDRLWAEWQTMPGHPDVWIPIRLTGRSQRRWRPTRHIPAIRTISR